MNEAGSAFEESKCYGSVFALNDFIKDCKSGLFTDYDGIVGEVIQNGFVIESENMSPSKFLVKTNYYLKKQREKGQLSVVWYNN